MQRVAVISIGAVLAVPCAWALLYLLPPLNGDAASILYFADRMLAGDRLYVDLIDVNPPLIFWLNVIPAWIARQAGTDPAVTFIALVLGLHAASLLLCRHSFRQLGEVRAPFARTLVPLAALAALLVLPGADFGQRCHLMVVLALPYTMITALRLQGGAPSTGNAVLAAALATVGFLIKPYYLIIPLALELVLLLRRGWHVAIARPEPLVLSLGGLAYALAALTWCPAYFDTVLPLVAKYYLSPGWHRAVAIVFGVEGRWIALAALVPVAAFALASRRRPLLLVAVTATLAAALVAALQGKGWPYHLLPFWQGAILTGALVLAGLAQRLVGLGHAAAMRTLAAASAAVLLAVITTDQDPLADRFGYHDSLAGRFQSRLAHGAADRPVLWLTDAIYPHYPVVLYDRARPSMAPMGLWMLHSLYAGASATPGVPIMRAPAQMSADERALFDQVGTALERARPALVLVAAATAEWHLPTGTFDYLAYFLRHPSFAREWHHYRELAPIDGTRVFERIPGTLTAGATSVVGTALP